MTLAAAAAVPLTLTHFTVTVQWFPSKRAALHILSFQLQVFL